MVRKLGVLAGCAALMLASACGAERPSVDDMTKSLKDGKAGAMFGITDAPLTDAQFECISKAIVDSDLSDDAVDAVSKGDKGYKGSKDDAKALTDIGTDIAACTTP